MVVSTSIIFQLDIDKTKIGFREVATAISRAGGDVVAVDVIHAAKNRTTRDITVNLSELDTAFSYTKRRILTQLYKLSLLRHSVSKARNARPVRALSLSSLFMTKLLGRLPN